MSVHTLTQTTFNFVQSYRVKYFDCNAHPKRQPKYFEKKIRDETVLNHHTSSPLLPQKKQKKK